MSENLSAKYYQGNKERLQKKACGRYQNLSEEEKRKKPQYGRELCKNLSEDEKKKVAEYRKKSYKKRKKHFIIIIRMHLNLEKFDSL